jgi:hypothetical protein
MADNELRLRRLILALLAFGLIALGGELLAIGHFEDAWQIAPLGLIAVTTVVIAWHVVGGGVRGFALLGLLFVLLLAIGLVGIGLHFSANVQFQYDINPEIGGWTLFVNVMHAIAPPALAPGVMTQLGLLGLIYLYKHPGRRNAFDGTV